MTAALARWLLAAIADDETDARQWAKDYDRYVRERTSACGCQASIALAPYVAEDADEVPVTTTPLHPARVLAECAAKRQIIERYLLFAEATDARYRRGVQRSDPASGTEIVVQLAGVVQLLAQPYAGRPGWQTEWALP